MSPMQKSMQRNAIVKPMSSLKYFQLSRFGKPVCNRVVFRSIKKFKVRSILEIGLGDAQRSVNMIRIAQKYGTGTSVRYTGIDLFEGRDATAAPLKLVQAHKLLKTTEAKTQLVPGTVGNCIKQIANSHVRTDLIVISAGYDLAELESVWSFFPRMLHAESLVFLQPQDSDVAKFKMMNRLEIERLAKIHVSTSKKTSVAA